MSVRFFLATCLGILVTLGTSCLVQEPTLSYSAQTLTISATPTETAVDPAANLQERWRKYEEWVKQLKYDRALFAFMTSHTPADLTLQDRGILLDATQDVWVRDIIVPTTRPNEFPLVIVSNPNPSTAHSTLVFTWRSNHWDWQSLPYVDLNEVKLARYIPQTTPPELFIEYEDCDSCSATSVLFDVWRWSGSEWGPLWQMPRAAHGGAHVTIDLDANLDLVHRRFSSWGAGGDKNIFDESNPGPHRYFVETWQRVGNEYVLITTRTEQSAYNALVEFSYAMNQADWAGARVWATSDAVVQEAQTLQYREVGGLTLPPWQKGKPLDANCSSTKIEECATWRVSTDSSKVKSRNFTVHLVKQGDKWFVSQIE